MIKNLAIRISKRLIFSFAAKCLKSNIQSVYYIDHGLTKLNKKSKDRKVFQGWNNLSDFEREQLTLLY
jgi:hypothetical protein